MYRGTSRIIEAPTLFSVTGRREHPNMVIYIYTYMRACMHECMDVWMYGCMYACMHGCMDVCMYGCM